MIKNIEKLFNTIGRKILDSSFKQDFYSLPYRAESKTYTKVLKELK